MNTSCYEDYRSLLKTYNMAGMTNGSSPCTIDPKTGNYSKFPLVSIKAVLKVIRTRKLFFSLKYIKHKGSYLISSALVLGGGDSYPSDEFSISFTMVRQMRYLL